VEDSNRKLYEELGELARYIETTMRKLGEVELPAKAATAHLPQASEHLRDLTRMTEEGTHAVMGLTESIQDNHAAVAGALDQLADALVKARRGSAYVDRVNAIKKALACDEKQLLDIMTALSFQDLVAQRVKKIVTILEDVQHKLLEMVVVFGCSMDEEKGNLEGRAGEMLKELEASRSTALKQDLVDEILGQFGFEGAGTAVSQ
jgi:chemotaxis protein CheZ